MKKTFLFTISLAALTLAGCGSKPEPVETPEPTPDVTIDFLGEELVIPGASVDKTREEALKLEF